MSDTPAKIVLARLLVNVEQPVPKGQLFRQAHAEGLSQSVTEQALSDLRDLNLVGWEETYIPHNDIAITPAFCDSGIS